MAEKYSDEDSANEDDSSNNSSIEARGDLVSHTPVHTATADDTDDTEQTNACKKKRVCRNEKTNSPSTNERTSPFEMLPDISDETGEVITSLASTSEHDKRKFSNINLCTFTERGHLSSLETQSMNVETDILEPNLHNNSAIAEAFYQSNKERANCKLTPCVMQTSQSDKEFCTRVLENQTKLCSFKIDPQIFQDKNNSSVFSGFDSANCSEESKCSLQRLGKANAPAINSLPSSILINIFRNLSTFALLHHASLVCRLWYQLCRDPDLWRHINLKGQLKVSDDVLKQITLFSDRIISIDVSDAKFVSDHGIIATVANFKHIHTLKLSRCYNIQDSGVQAIGENCPYLKHLHLDGCYGITDMSLHMIARGCPGLTVLHLSQCTRIGDDGVISLAQKCTSLQQLLLDHCSKVTDRGILELISGCPDLQYLGLMSCSVSDVSVRELVMLKKLCVLDVSIVSQLTPRSVVDVVRSCKEIECLNISLNTVMDDDCIENIAKYGQNIKRLYCVSCKLSDKALESVAKYSKKIEILDVGWCQDITDEGVRMLSMSCPSLRYLGLIRCDQVTAETMEHLVVHYPHINYSTFILESKKLLDRARREGFILDEQRISANRTRD